MSPFTVAYGVDKAKVRDAVLGAARAVPFTMAEDNAHKTQVWMTGFGDSALNFELLVWPTVEAVKRPGVDAGGLRLGDRRRLARRRNRNAIPSNGCPLTQPVQPRR